MSTTFCVYPKNTYVPTFEEVINLANSKLSEYLRSIALIKHVCLSVELQTVAEHNKVTFGISDCMNWTEDKYAWFYINKIAGGTDCYFYKFTDMDREFWTEELNTKQYNQEIKDIIENSLKIDHYWYFRRSAGQPGIIALSYGLLAASLAILTDGFIFTDDGAWDYSLFPALPDDFLKWYFKPNLAQKSEDREFSKRCIEHISDEIEQLS